MIFPTGPSAINVKTADDPTLSHPGCWYVTRKYTIIGILAGMTLGGIFGGSRGLRYGLQGRELFRIVGKEMYQIGTGCGLVTIVGSSMIC